MGISKVVYGDRTLIDLTNDTVSPENLLLGETAHDASGELIVGTAAGGSSNKIFKNQTLTFNNLVATITDSSFTATSDYAVLYHSPSYAEQAKITTESSSGTLTFTATTTPENTIVCDVVIFNASSGGGGGVHIYSTIEHEVGEWIDGRTIYERTFDFGSDLSCLSGVWTDTGIPKGLILLLVNAQLQGDNGTLYVANVNADTNGNIGIYNPTSSTIGIRYITIQYTKNVAPPVHYIEYIQSTGTQYINTGVGANAQSIRIESAIEFQTTSNDGFAWGGFGNGHYGLADIYNDRMNARLKFFYGSNQSLAVDSPVYSADTKYTIDMTATGSQINYIINGETKTLAKYGSYLAPSDICLFRRGTDNSYTGRCKMYYFKLYVDGILIRDMKPALDNNNVACMYDEMSAEYFYNLGSGVFTAGGDI